MRKLGFAILAIAIFGATEVCAQTVSPPVTEVTMTKGAAHGEIVVSNPGILPLVVVLEPHSFSVDAAGKPQFSISPDLHLRLSETSAKIAAKSDRAFTWDVQQCPQGGASFQIFVFANAAAKTTEGVQIRNVVGVAVYIEPRTISKTDYSAILSADGRTLSLVNSGENIARPHVFITVNKHREELGPFPMFSHATRDISLPDAAEAAVRKFPHFEIAAVRKAAETAQK